MTAHPFRQPGLIDMDTPVRRRMVMWLMISVLAALLAYFAFRGYLHPEFLFHFGSGMYC